MSFISALHFCVLHFMGIIIYRFIVQLCMNHLLLKSISLENLHVE